MWWVVGLLMLLSFGIGFVTAVFRLPNVIANLDSTGLDMLAARVQQVKARSRQ